MKSEKKGLAMKNCINKIITMREPNVKINDNFTISLTLTNPYNSPHSKFVRDDPGKIPG